MRLWGIHATIYRVFECLVRRTDKLSLVQNLWMMRLSDLQLAQVPMPANCGSEDRNEGMKVWFQERSTRLDMKVFPVRK